MADDGEAVLAAITTLRQRLSDAIWFSRGIYNHAGWGGKLESDRVEAYHQRELERHQQWQEEFEQALGELQSAGYPTSDNWHRVYLGQPQIAFSDVPVQADCEGTPLGITWVMGTGGHPGGEPPNPPDMAGSITAGEHIGADGDEVESEELTGLVSDDIVREWERVYSEVADVERRMMESRMRYGGNASAYQPNDREQRVIEMIRSIGRRLTKQEACEEMEERGHRNHAAIGETLGVLCRAQLLNNTTDSRGKGYGLAEWSTV